MKEYIFTFGYGQKHCNCFVAIEAESYNEARTKMHKTFGDKWSFQYDSREDAGTEKYNLTEIYLKDFEGKEV